jgi:ring-1,2-phenylacetyl-CoA epoxidase subunit PaaE
MLTYHPLTVSEMRAEASDGLCIALEVPPDLRETYRFLPGQHIGLRAHIDGQEVRRTYSICSGAEDRQLRIGVRVHEHGSMSRHLLGRLKVGDTLDVLAPTGRFFVEIDPSARHTYCAFAAGSGITPILGILKHVLPQEPHSRFMLFYGNRSTSTIMFAEELLAMKDRFPDRLSLNFLMSREPQEIDLLNGRLDGAKVEQLARDLFHPLDVDAYFLCGPGTMIDAVTRSLVDLGVASTRIHAERFAADAPARTTVTDRAKASAERAPSAQSVEVTVVMDGRRRSFSMTSGAQTVLEAAENAGLELPYSCRAGVCSTCRTRVTKGSVNMTTNYALEPWEVAAGYVLCCQSLPTSAELELNYDER